MSILSEYDRGSAVRYAHQWAYGRNPRFYNYDQIGGDCTNFASQCLLAGGAVMNFTPTFGWYYMSANEKAPAWTGVEQLYRFLTRSVDSAGPKARECVAEEVQPGDLVQFSSVPGIFGHTPVIVAASAPFSPETILVAAHTVDTDYRPLSAYTYSRIRFLHIEGIRRR